jgi:drug/metabolite transporter (DMT)-like permease
LLLFFSAPKAARCCLALPLTSFLFGLTTMLASGNLLSARYPRRFHYTLARRDRPVPASFVWILVTLGAGALMVLALMTVAARTGLPLWIALAGLPVLGVFCYGLTLPVAARWTMARKEHIIESISHSG